MALSGPELLSRLRNIQASALALGRSAEALIAELAAAPAEPVDVAPAAPPASAKRRPIAWGAKVSETFRDRVWWIAGTLQLDPDDLMSCMAWESGETFSPSVRNMAGSGATGLIQFMPKTAAALGTSTAALAAMTAEDQLNYVYKYFRPWAGRLNTLGDVYMAILWPKAVGKPDDYALFTGGIAYRQNAGLDINRDGVVTKAECCAKVLAKKAKGMRPEMMA
jgi:hypothetical protein